MRYITNCLIFLLVHYLPPQPARNRPGSPPSTLRPTPRQRTPPQKLPPPMRPTPNQNSPRRTPNPRRAYKHRRPEAWNPHARFTPAKYEHWQNPKPAIARPASHASLQNTHTPVRKPDASHATDFKWQESIIPPMRYLRPKPEVNTPCSIQFTVKSRINQKIESLRNDACVKYR